LRHGLCSFDVPTLRGLVSITKQDHHNIAVPSIIDALSRPEREAQLVHPVAYGFGIAEVALSDTVNAFSDPYPRDNVAQLYEPVDELCGATDL